MKVIVHNYEHQYALSRQQVENIRSILPREYFAPIRELHLTWNASGNESFEFSKESKIAYFAYPVEQKTDSVVRIAVQELLIGLIRIKSGSRFGRPLKEKERIQYLPFIDQWLEPCLEAIRKNKA